MYVKNSLHQGRTLSRLSLVPLTPVPAPPAHEMPQGNTHPERKAAPVAPPKCHRHQDFQAQTASAPPQLGDKLLPE